jgi:hypothetical protein
MLFAHGGSADGQAAGIIIIIIIKLPKAAGILCHGAHPKLRT